MLQHKATWNKIRDVWEAPEMDLISGRWAVYSETLPRSGSMRSGELYELPTWEPATEEQGYSYLPTPRASDGPDGGPNMRGSKGDKPSPAAVMDLLPTPTANIGDNGGSQDPDKRRAGGHSVSIQDVAQFELLPTPKAGDGQFDLPRTSGRPPERSTHLATRLHYTDFGSYASAIRRHECAFGRVAPDPTAPTGRNGAHRLSSRFVEWMMGLPDQWVTGCGLSRSAELRILGNGVVPRQATAALTEMKAVFESRAAQAA